ncbi:CHAP domain-containing protein [Anaerospora hongkongensis]|uniref:CHAP domain-containing protein n=1 Tax=Anaerospora hongkongensis TaxID=244830 RepID=UPI0028A1EC9A|nr:CHAP domain-containing protein [Anaerospora hongkongensis]
MRKSVLLTLLFLICFSNNVFAEDWHSLPDGICARYAAQEFAKIAPSPGVNWLNYNYDWLIQAEAAGWVVKTTVRDVMVGAIAEWQGLERDGGHVAIVRKVLSDRIIVEEQNIGSITGSLKYTFQGIHYNSQVTSGWGKVTIRAIKYEDMLKMDTKKFMGYIWPVRKSEYEKEPAKYQISFVEQMNSKEPLYKGFKEYWAPAYELKEFDKIAPEPGVNWRGNVREWVKNSAAAGWITKNDPSDARIGALVIRYNFAKDWAKVGIVRGMKNNILSIDTRKANLYPVSEELRIDDLRIDKEGYTFLGYIWPERL